MDVPDHFLISTILEVIIYSAVRDCLTLYFTVLDPIIIRKSTIIEMGVLYLDAVYHSVALKSLFSVDSRS